MNSPGIEAEGAQNSAGVNSHLSYPSPSSAVPTPSPPPSAQPRPLLKDRLYIGNLHSTVDEYTLLQAFSKFGRISKLDYLFHKTGPLKGKPRGYAFLEYAEKDRRSLTPGFLCMSLKRLRHHIVIVVNPGTEDSGVRQCNSSHTFLFQDAQRALASANGKLLRGRKLVVTYAHQAPLDEAGLQGARYRRPPSEAAKPTTLSLMKSAATGRADAVDAKIARMEAKLRQLEQSSSSAIPSSSSSSLHPSLPPKPHFSPAPPVASSTRLSSSRASVPSSRPLSARSASSTRMNPSSTTQMKPLSASPLSGSVVRTPATPPAIPTPPVPPVKKAPLSGVRIVKKKG
ncbi:hypothetical protein OBBRIDRAFT_802098 [Obba rivulosa]|uniref:Probable RNA-binding protein 18 n=1 Tax=Obba rivulosa TaxID=1052685 RepID=A0A8E2DP79_9APHY|nr:hypothetical protein OBBRIDRAFT_802098 [Obba rivulosa]